MAIINCVVCNCTNQIYFTRLKGFKEVYVFDFILESYLFTL